MSGNLKAVSKVFFITGIILLFISLFMDWYFFQATDSKGNIVIVWSYYLFYGWQTTLPSNTFINELYLPENVSVPIIIPILMIISLLMGVYGVIAHDLEKKVDFSALRKYAYANLIVLLMTGFFILIFPAYYLISNNLYYPFMNFNDIDLGVHFVYRMGIGYFMQIIAFILIFPFIIFNFQTIRTFEKKKHSPRAYIAQILEQVKETIDLDRFITEEKLILERSKSKIEKSPIQDTIKETEIDHIYHKFLESRKVI
ncbi:MAG: hypothetical protein ACFFA8_03975 [Promethearchaeota archaeon]